MLRYLMAILPGLLWPFNLDAGDGFALRDGDRVVFLGDSITAARTYTKVIENYTILRFPDRRVQFVNSGWGGDTAAGGLARLERDVFAHRPTVLTICYGLNDIGWGLKANDEHRRRFLDSIRGIIAQCQERRIRVYVLSGPVTAADPEKSEGDFLQSMCDEAMTLARESGEHSIDVQRGMREIQKRIGNYNAKLDDEKKHVKLHAADGVHLNDLGHLAMAFVILKGLEAPAEVSAAWIDAATLSVNESRSCAVTSLKQDGSRLEFDRLDEGLPLNLGIFGALNYVWVPIHTELAKYELCVKHLPVGRYTVTVDGRSLGAFSDRQLSNGVNIVYATDSAWHPGGPWDVQANLLKSLTDARHDVAIAKMLGARMQPEVSTRAEISSQTEEINQRLEELQRTIARPRPYRFVIAPVEP